MLKVTSVISETTNNNNLSSIQYIYTAFRTTFILHHFLFTDTHVFSCTAVSA